MKWQWLFLILTVILGIAWLLRWEEVTTQKNSKLTAIHKTDRWTGQAWIEVFSFSDREEKSNIPDEQIETLKSKLLSHEEETKLQDQLRLVKAEIQRLEMIKVENGIRHVLYNAKARQVREEIIDKSGSRYAWIDKYQPPSVRAVESCDIDDELRQEVEKQLKQEIIDSHNAYCLADSSIKEKERSVTELEQQIQDAKQEAELTAITKARATLEEEAWKKRNDATKVWGGLMGVSFVLSLFSFVRRKKKHAVSS